MHNNGTLGKDRTAKKPSYSVVEAAVLLARADGAKTASDPRIGEYSAMITQAIAKGDLRTEDEDADAASSPAVSFDDLKAWVTKHLPGKRPAFLFAKDK